MMPPPGQHDSQSPPAPATGLAEIHHQLRETARVAGLAANLVEAALSVHDYFALAEAIVPRRSKLVEHLWRPLLDAIEAAMRIKTLTHPAAFGDVLPIAFGTSGHRGEIGRGLTLVHVHAIISALIEQTAALSPSERKAEYGSRSLEEVQVSGFVIGHDNRLLNPEFSAYSAWLLRKAGYRVYYAGRLSSPEVSRVIPYMGWAGGINFTPSHNPFRYGGIKTNPADGGLSSTELTAPLEVLANRKLQALDPAAWPTAQTLAELLEQELSTVERVDIHEPYLACLRAHPVIRLGELRTELEALPPERDLRWVADPVWGGAVPVYKRLREEIGASLTVLHTEQDPYFDGQTTEPNEKTLQDALNTLKADKAPFEVAIRNDPDGDRGLVGDRDGPIKTNRFAALIMRYLIDIGAAGDVTTTLPTSHFGVAYARRQGRIVHITPTGFKHFRPFLRTGDTMFAYEESDGISIAGHCLDKDGILTGLLAVRIVLHYGRSLNALLAEIETELGHYHWHQATFTIPLSAKQALERLETLGTYQPGQQWEAGKQTYRLAKIDANDGYKFLFEDGSWVMMRPSGTEPKIRVYAETVASPEASAQLAALGERLARQAMAR